jgi:predicted metalloprotease with PDZ domain
VGKSGGVGDVEMNGPAYKAGFGPGMKIVAVNGRAFSVPILRTAVQEAKGPHSNGQAAPIEFIVENTGFYRVLKIDYHEGEKFPVFERVAGTPDRMDDILKPMTR